MVSARSRGARPSLMSRLTGRHRGGAGHRTTGTAAPTHHGNTRHAQHHHQPTTAPNYRAQAHTHSHAHATTAPPPVQHHRRRPSLGDRVSGAMLKLKGSLTRRPGQKAAGARRMHGTDGRGSHRHYY